jgi:Ca2+-transporting ATPase
MGVFGNRNMNFAFAFSMVLVLAVVYVPILQKIFDTVSLGWRQWEVIVPLLLIPSLASEAVKYYLQRQKA